MAQVQYQRWLVYHIQQISTIIHLKLFNDCKFLKQFLCLLAYYERFFKELQTQVHGEAVTGLLLIYPAHIIHTVEVRVLMQIWTYMF